MRETFSLHTNTRPLQAMMGPFELLLLFLERSLADADRKIARAAERGDWSDHAYHQRRARDIRRQREALVQLIGASVLPVDIYKALDSAVNSG